MIQFVNFGNLNYMQINYYHIVLILKSYQQFLKPIKNSSTVSKTKSK